MSDAIAALPSLVPIAPFHFRLGAPSAQGALLCASLDGK
jgi:hypothetical protein